MHDAGATKAQGTSTTAQSTQDRASSRAHSININSIDALAVLVRTLRLHLFGGQSSRQHCQRKKFSVAWHHAGLWRWDVRLWSPVKHGWRGKRAI